MRDDGTSIHSMSEEDEDEEGESEDEDEDEDSVGVRSLMYVTYTCFI